MSHYLWIQHETAAKSLIDAVSFERCVYVANFVKEVKKEFAFTVPSSEGKDGNFFAVQFHSFLIQEKTKVNCS
jgi:hypothetical protein